MKHAEAVRSLLGKRVKVTVCQGDGDDDAVIVIGRLLGFGEGGDFEVLDDSDGFVHFCWPMLDIREVE